MSRFPNLLCVGCVIIVMLLSACGSQPTQAVQDLYPIDCHHEPFVGVIYITLRNNGTDAGTSSMHISYTVGTTKKLPVNIQMNLPFIPAQSERMVMVNVPTAIAGAVAATDTSHYKNPEGTIIIKLSNKSGGAKQATKTFTYNC